MSTSDPPPSRWWFALGQRGHFHFEGEVCVTEDDEGEPLYQVHVLGTLLSLHSGIAELLCEREKETFRLFVRASLLTSFQPIPSLRLVESLPSSDEAPAPSAPASPSRKGKVLSLIPARHQPKDEPT